MQEMSVKQLETRIYELEEQLKQIQLSEQKFIKSINDLKEMLVRFSADGVITIANDAYCKYFNKSRLELIGQNYLPHIPQEDIVEIQKLTHSLTYTNSTATIEHRVILPNGNIRWTRWIHQAFFDKNHKHIDTQAIGIDITEQRMMQSELRKKDMQLKAIYNNAGVGICLLSADGTILDVNKRFKEMFDFSEADLIGKNCSIIVDNSSKLTHNSYFDQLNDKQVSFLQTDLLYKKKTGETFWCELIVSPILKDDATVESIIYILNNIEERKRVEKRQKEIIQKTSSEKEKAELANNAKAEFIAQMSHEIRTPMNAIINMTDAVLDTELTLLQRDCLETVKNSSEQLLELINDILDFSKIEAERLIVENEDFNLFNELNVLFKSINPIALPKSILLKLKLADNVPKYLKGDARLLRQIILNLMSNSIKFTKHGSITLIVSLADDQTGMDVENNINLNFCVRDTGIGIPYEKLDSIFESFTQGDASISKKYGGTGLGLTITKKFVLAMGGSIKVSSKEGEGSEFTFNIPFELSIKNNIDEASDGSKGNLDDHQASGSASLSHLKLNLLDNEQPKNQIRILLVEDNETNRKVANHFLSKKGYYVGNASNGKEALQMLLEANYDIVLMDVEMPIMDGYEATLYIRNGEGGTKNINIPVIGMTAHIGKYYEDKCFEVGMNNYAPKPIRFQSLEAIIIDTLKKAKLDKKERKCSDVFDINSALSLYDGDIVFLKELMQLFKTSKPYEVLKLRNILFGDENSTGKLLETAIIIAHTIKGDASAIGAIKLYSISIELEKSLKDNNIELAKRFFDKFEAEFNSVLDCIPEIDFEPFDKKTI